MNGRLLEECIEEVADGAANGGIAVGRLLSGDEFVVAEAENAGVAVVDESHWPDAAEAITNLVLTAVLSKDIVAAVLQLHLVEVLVALAHLLEPACAVKNALAAAAQAAEPSATDLLRLYGLPIGTVAAEELLGQSGCHLCCAPAIIPTSSPGHAAGLAGAQAEIATVGLVEVGSEVVSSSLAIHISSDAN